MALLQTVLTDGDGPGPRWRTWLAELWRQKGKARDLYDLQALVGAHRRRPGHADARQLDHHVRTRALRCGWRLSSRQGHGAPNPTWIPVGQRRRTPDGAPTHGRRTPGGTIGEPFNRPMTAHFIGGCTIGDTADDGRRRRLPAGLRPSRPARRRRVGDLGQPRRQPVADDHRPGRARDGVLAQQGRARPPARARDGVPPRSSRSPRSRPPSRSPHRRRCACRSSASPSRIPADTGVTRPGACRWAGRSRRQLPRRCSDPGHSRLGPVRARPPSLPGRALTWRPAPCWGAGRCGAPDAVRTACGPPRRDAGHLDSGRGGTRPGPRRRLRRAVRPADRPAGPRGPRLLRDRAAHDAGRGDAGARSPKAIILSGGPSSVYAEGAPGVDAALFDAGVPVFGICYGFQAMAQALGGEVARTGAREFGRTRVAVTAPGTLLAELPDAHTGLDDPRRLGAPRRPPGFDVLAVDRRRPRSRPSRTSTAARRRAVAPRGAAHRARPGVLEHFLHRHRRLPADLDDGQHRRGAGRARSASRSARPATRSAGCPAASTPRSRRRWCSARSATG